MSRHAIRKSVRDRLPNLVRSASIIFVNSTAVPQINIKGKGVLNERYFPYDWYCWIIPFTMQTRAVVVRKDENGQRVYELRESVRSAGENWHCYSYVMFWDRSRSTESELQMSKIWSDLCIFIGSYPWSTAEQTHRLRHHHHSISLCILKKNSMVLCSAIDQRIRQIEMSQNISNILCWIL